MKFPEFKEVWSLSGVVTVSPNSWGLSSWVTVTPQSTSNQCQKLPRCEKLKAAKPFATGCGENQHGLSIHCVLAPPVGICHLLSTSNADIRMCGLPRAVPAITDPPQRIVEDTGDPPGSHSPTAGASAGLSVQWTTGISATQ